jgi:hypothetical protein
MNVPRQCPLVLLVKYFGEEVRRWEVNKIEMKCGERRKVKGKLVQIILVCTSKKTQHFTMTKTSCSILFKEIIAT